MTTPDLAPLVAAAAQMIVRAMTIPNWPAVRDRFTSLLARGETGRAGTVAADLDATRASVLAGQLAPGSAEARLRGDLDALLAARPDQAGPLGAGAARRGPRG